jgi:hypothetical protein
MTPAPAIWLCALASIFSGYLQRGLCRCDIDIDNRALHFVHPPGLSSMENACQAGARAVEPR